jgi:hypothetical protein
MKTTASKPTFKGTKASKDFLKNDSNIEAPGRCRHHAPSRSKKLTSPVGMAYPYTQVVKAGLTSTFTNTLVQAPPQDMPKVSTISVLPVSLPYPNRSYASVATAAPPKSTDDFAGWNAKVKCVFPDKPKTSLSPAMPMLSLPQPVVSTSLNPVPRIPRRSKTTAPSLKKNPPKSTTTFKFVANTSSPNSSANSYAPPSSLARPKVNITTPHIVAKNTTATGSVTGIKIAPPKLVRAFKTTPNDLPTDSLTSSLSAAAPKAHVIAPPIAGVKNAEDSQTTVKKRSTTKKIVAAQSKSNLPKLAVTEISQKKGKKVALAPVLSSPPTVHTKPVENNYSSRGIDEKIIDNTATTANTIVPAAIQNVASSDVVTQNSLSNDEVVAASVEQEQGMTSISCIQDASNHYVPVIATADSPNDALSVPRKKKRNQKSGAQRKKEARTRVLAELSVDAQNADRALAIQVVTTQDINRAIAAPIIATKDADPALAVAFVNIQIAKMDIQAGLDALKYILSRSVSRLESMARSMPFIKMSRRYLEKDLRAALTALFMQGVQVNVHEKTYELSDGYKAQHGEDIKEEHDRRMEEVANHEVKAYRNVSTNLKIHARAAKALEELKAKPVAPLFQAREVMPSTSDFQFGMPEALRVLDASASPAGEAVDFKLPQLASDFSFSMPSGFPSVGKDVTTVLPPEIKDFPSLFGGPAVAAADALKLSTEPPDTDTSESDDISFRSEESDSSATEDESLPDAIVEKEEPCWVLTKFHDPLVPTPQTITVQLLSRQQCSLVTEIESMDDSNEEEQPCLALIKYHNSLLYTTAVASSPLNDAESSPATKDAAEPAIVSLPTAAIEVLQIGIAFAVAVAVKLTTPFQSLRSQILPVKLGFDFDLPPNPLQLLDHQGSYNTPPALTLEAPPVKDAAARPVEDATPSHAEHATPSPARPSKATVLSRKSRRIPRATSTPEQRKQRGPYRLNYLIGISPLRELLMELADPYARTYTKAELIGAFVALSSRERDRLDIGFPHSWTAEGVLNNGRLANRIMLGSIRLSEYLDEIAFYEGGIAQKSDVLGAWRDLAAQDEAFSALEDAEKDT